MYGYGYSNEDDRASSVTTFQAETDGVCPHCQKHVHFNKHEEIFLLNGGTYRPLNQLTDGTNIFKIPIGQRYSDSILVAFSKCPSCKKPIVSVDFQGEEGVRLGYPTQGSKSVDDSVPKEIAKDYQESLLVLQYSSNASAALSRRCLENILKKQGFNNNRLSEKIAAAKRSLPSYIVECIDASRSIGNLAAHPNVDSCSGTLLDVDQDEAELMIHMLEELFDHYYIKPKKNKEVMAKFEGKRSGKRASQ